MKTVVIKAYDGKGENKQLAGEREVQKPESLAEAVKLHGNEEYVLKRYWNSEVIFVQNQLRTGSASKAEAFKTALIGDATKDKAADDPTLFNRLVQLGVIKQ